MRGDTFAVAGRTTLLLAVLCMMVGVVVAGPSATDDQYDMTVSADQLTYTCSPDCMAYFNLSNSGPINGTLDNLTVFNNFSFDASQLEIGLSIHDGTQFVYQNTVSGDRAIDIPTAGGQAVWNQSAGGVARSTSRYRINLSNDGSVGKWNYTVQLGASNSSTTWFENFTLDPYIMDIDLVSPNDGATLSDKRPTFTINYSSSENSSMDFVVQANKSGSMENVTETKTVSNATDTDLMTLASETFSEGIYTWRAWGDSDADGVIQDEELSVNRTVVIDDQDAPDLSINAPIRAANITGLFEVNVSANDSFTGVNNSTVLFAISNGTANISGSGEIGNWTQLSQWKTTLTYNGTLDTTAFNDSDAGYTLWANASDDVGNQNLTKVADLTFDNTPPNGTDDLNLTTENFTALDSYDILDDLNDPPNRLLGNNTVGLNWTGYDPATELTDATSGVRGLRLNASFKSFNETTQSFSNWSYWIYYDDLLDSGVKTSNKTVNKFFCNSKIRYSIDVLDYTNQSTSSNLVNVTMDGCGPKVSSVKQDTIREYEEPGGKPRIWTNQTDPRIVFNISDLTGINRRIGNRSEFGRLNLSLHDEFSAFIDYIDFNVSPDGFNFDEYRINTSPLPSLNESENYSIWHSGYDVLGNKREKSYSVFVKTDFTPPYESDQELSSGNVNGSISSSETGPFYNNWFRDEVNVTVNCYKGSGYVAPIDAYRTDTQGWQEESWFTISENGTRTFKCRDAAGNIADNNNTNTTIDDLYIDTAAPTFSNKQPSDEATGVNTGPKISLDYDDAHSGVDLEHKEFILENGETYNLTGNASWQSNNVDIDLANEGITLDKGVQYKAYVTICDNVNDVVEISDWEGDDHCAREQWTFVVEQEDTEEEDSSSGGGGGGYSTGTSDLGIVDVPGSVSVEPGSSTEIDIQVENTGEVIAEAELSGEIESGDGISSFTPEDEQRDIGVDNTETVTFTLETTDSFDSNGTVSANFLADSAAEAEINVTVAEQEADDLSESLDVSLDNSTVEFPADGSANVTLTVTNDGEADLVNISTSFQGSSDSITPELFDLDAGESQDVSVVVTAPSDAVNIYDFDLTVGNDAVSRRIGLTVKVQPSDSEQKEQIESDLTELDNEVEELEDSASKDEIASTLSEAKEARESGDYARAADLASQAREMIRDNTGTATAQESGGGLWWLLVIVVILLGGAGGGGYYYYVEYYEPGEEDEEPQPDFGPDSSFEPPSVQAEQEEAGPGIWEQVQSSASDFFNALGSISLSGGTQAEEEEAATESSSLTSYTAMARSDEDDEEEKEDDEPEKIRFRFND